MHLIRKEHSLRFLIIRALIALAIVIAGLLYLRISGTTRWEQDLPMEAVEQTVEGLPAEAPGSQTALS